LYLADVIKKGVLFIYNLRIAVVVSIIQKKWNIL